VAQPAPRDGDALEPLPSADSDPAGGARPAAGPAGPLGGVGLAVESSTNPAAVLAPVRRRPRVFFWLAVAWVVLVVLGAIFADVLPIRSPIIGDIPNRLSAPGQHGFLLGSDSNGRDILARLVFGARVSLIVSLTAVLVGSVVGGAIGLTTGFFRGWYERIVMSGIDVLLAFPALILILALVAYLNDQSLRTIALVFGFLAIPSYARVARATTLSVAEREYVLAARALGAKSSRILLRELLPNVALPIAAFGLVAVGVVIVAEGGLAFLGLSVELPSSTWGLMIAEGKIHLRDAPWVALIPSLTMLLTVLSLNYVGDSLRSRFDVRESAL
jgi:peptide/nickel transport system permease protein